MSTDIRVRVNGREVRVPEGCVVSAAIARAGIWGCRRSISGSPRGALCGMGVCFECRVTINGVPHSRGCQRPCEDGMELQTDE